MFISKLEKYNSPQGEPKEIGGDSGDYKNPWNVRLVKAYPYTVASIPYSAGPSQLVKATVGFYYEYSHLMTFNYN